MKKVRKQREPSRASLREMPEVDFSKGKVFRNPYAARIAAEGVTFPGRGRPKKGEEPGPTKARSIRFPVQVDAALEKAAKARGLTVHAAVRTAVVAWIGAGEPR
ncbi:MAG: hypothetical protein A2V77_02770 [Anaeromyxobacter sp. RBG_16_69_14]|nr:MAG: hypothetical protein A2V77_02770 [Anaeromyxobacter sp. RBG_16_69_14]